MAMPAPLCTHVKTDGSTCGSPAAKGSDLCFHHSAEKTANGKEIPADQAASGGFAPIPFVFPEDRVAMQFNYFLLLQALNEQRVDRRTVELMLRMLRAMDKNLGKEGSLPSIVGEETVSNEQVGGKAVGEDYACSDTRFAPESSGGTASKIAASAETAGGRPASEKPMNAETEAALKVIAEISSAGWRYTDLPEIGAPHLAGQSKLNVNYQPTMRR